MKTFKQLELVKQKDKLTPLQELQKKYALDGMDPFGDVFGPVFFDDEVPEFEDVPF